MKKVLITRFFPGPAIDLLREKYEVDYRDGLYPMER